MPAIIRAGIFISHDMTLIEFERLANLSAKQASRLLGVPLPTYYQYRREQRCPLILTRFMEVLSLLSESQLNKLIRKHVNGIN